MPFYKVICTTCWEFESDGSLDQAMQKARRLADDAIDHNPHGEDYQGFGVQMELVPIKDRTASIVKLKEYTPKQVFAMLTDDDEKTSIKVGRKTYEVKMNSDRYHLFKKNPCCVACGIKGVKFVLECQPGESAAHFNLYAEEDGRMVLMTKDHIKAKAYGGTDTMDNFSTLCAPCNQLKASYPISYENVKVLRDLLRNPDRLPTKELRRRINETRLIMMDCLNGQ